nr:hypothetical protein ISGA_627 [Gordonia sp. NB41Y]
MIEPASSAASRLLTMVERDAPHTMVEHNAPPTMVEQDVLAQRGRPSVETSADCAGSQPPHTMVEQDVLAQRGRPSVETSTTSRRKPANTEVLTFQR